MVDDPNRSGAAPPTGLAGRLPLLLIIASLVLTLAAIATVLVLARGVGRGAADTGPLAVPSVPAPGDAGRYCARLAALLPASVVSQARRELIDSQPGVAAWGDPAIVLRCGLEDPAELTCASPLVQFTDASGRSVSWLRLADRSAVTYIAVDRPVRIAVTVPPGAGIGPVQQLSEVVAAALPSRQVCSGGAVLAPDNR